MRLGQAEAADHLAGGHVRQPALPLLFAAVGVDGIHAQRGLHADEAADTAVATFQFLADQAVADPVQAGAAVLFRQRGAKQAEVGDFRYEFLREPALVECLADDGTHALVGEAGHGVLHRALFFGQQGTDIKQVVRVQGHAGFVPVRTIPHCMGCSVRAVSLQVVKERPAFRRPFGGCFVETSETGLSPCWGSPRRRSG